MTRPVAFCRDGVLFWHGDHAAHRGGSYDLYAAPLPASAIDLEQYAVAIQCAVDGMREAGGITNGKVADKLASLLALIDGRACSEQATGVYEVSGCQECGELHCCGGNDETPRDHCMDCSVHPGKPTKGEGEKR